MTRALERLLPPDRRATFVRENYLKLPYAEPGGCKGLTHLGAWEVIEHILARPDVDALLGRAGQRYDGAWPADVRQLRALLAEGYTLGIRHAERHHAGLAELAEGFRRDFLAPINVHLYCTPAEHPGFGWHYDAEEVFILQTQGGKEWWLRKNTVNPWPLVETIPADMRYEREIMPALRCTLLAGDWLYIPAGYWHRTQAGAESISLSVGVLAASALDVYDFLRRELLASLRWRQRLPAAGPAAALRPEELEAAYRELFAELGRDLAELLNRETTVRNFHADRERRFG
jgi:ribosomal protein L16 Arg81 hydroxylase